MLPTPLISKERILPVRTGQQNALWDEVRVSLGRYYAPEARWPKIAIVTGLQKGLRSPSVAMEFTDYADKMGTA